MSFVQGLNIFGSQRYLPFLELVPIRWIALSALARSNCEVDLLKTLVASSYMRRSELLSVPRMFHRSEGRSSLLMVWLPFRDGVNMSCGEADE